MVPRNSLLALRGFLLERGNEMKLKETTPHIYLICGRARHGKDEAADGKTAKAVRKRQTALPAEGDGTAKKERLFHVRRMPAHDSFARNIPHRVQRILNIFAVRHA